MILLIIDSEYTLVIILILIVTITRVINIEQEETLRDSFEDIQLSEPATVLDIQIKARVTES